MSRSSSSSEVRLETLLEDEGRYSSFAKERERGLTEFTMEDCWVISVFVYPNPPLALNKVLSKLSVCLLSLITRLDSAR